MKQGYSSGDYYNSVCEVDNNGVVSIMTYLCYNPLIQLSSTIMAGMYTEYIQSSVNYCKQWPNIYTNSYKCPSGFTAYNVSENCCWADLNTIKNCTETTTTFVCLSNA